MILYLSGLLSESEDFINKLNLQELSILQSFPYMNDNKLKYISKCKNFILDSGAFTMMNNKRKNFDVIEYSKKYGDFIKRNNINDFFEFDIDGIYGLDIYKDCLHIIQDITGKDPIRVFHTWRGIDYYKQLVKIKDRIAIGGLAVKQIRSADYDIFIELLQIAHNNNCKVHGLGITGGSNLRRYNFDSIDSSRWIMARRFALAQIYDGHNIKAVDICETGKSYKDEHIMLHNFEYWEKYSKYLEQF